MVQWVALVAAALWVAAALTLVAAKWIDPPTTAVQMERRVQSWFDNKPYRKRYDFVPLKQIAPDLQHAVIAAEDGRFYEHHGFDWQQIQIAADEDLEGGHRVRGASTITQQLVKNLLLGTERSLVRKGVYGAEAACNAWYGKPARAIGRDDAARLAAILPAPRRRRPERMNRYSGLIEDRMAQMGW